MDGESKAKNNSSKSKKPAKLTNFDAALLVLLRDAEGYGLSPYDVEQRIRQGDAGVLGRTASAVYARLPALAEKGLLYTTAVVGRRGRNANCYMLTGEGLEALDAWVFSAPLTLPRLDASEVLVRIRAARWLDEKTIWHIFEPLFFEMEAMQELLDRLQRDALRAKRWDFTKALELRLMQLQLDAYRMWLEEFGKEVGMTNPLKAKPTGPYVRTTQTDERGIPFSTKTRRR